MKIFVALIPLLISTSILAGSAFGQAPRPEQRLRDLARESVVKHFAKGTKRKLVQFEITTEKFTDHRHCYTADFVVSYKIQTPNGKTTSCVGDIFPVIERDWMSRFNPYCSGYLEGSLGRQFCY